MLSDYMNLIITFLAFVGYVYFKGKKGLKDSEESERGGAHPKKEKSIPKEDEDVNNTLEEFLNSFKKEGAPPKLPVSNPTSRPISKPKSVQEAGRTPSLSNLEGHRLQSNIESRKLTSAIESRQLASTISQRRIASQLKNKIEEQKDLKRRNEPSRGSIALKNLPHLRDMIIYDAILNKPKGW